MKNFYLYSQVHNKQGVKSNGRASGILKNYLTGGQNKWVETKY